MPGSGRSESGLESWSPINFMDLSPSSSGSGPVCRIQGLWPSRLPLDPIGGRLHVDCSRTRIAPAGSVIADTSRPAP